MTSTLRNGLSSDRVRDAAGVNIDHLLCSICGEILWKPVACQKCETPFCSGCINRWLEANPTNCPSRCIKYIERKCPPIIARMLGDLKIACFYQSGGCTMVLSYDALDKHEIDCEYQTEQCPACRSQILKKDIANHRNNCAAIELTCQDCKMVYKRGDTATRHTENMCLKEQLRQARDESRKNTREIQNLTRQLNAMQTANPGSSNVTLTFDDLPHAGDKCQSMPKMYRGLKWSSIWYMHLEFATDQYPKSGYTTFFKPGCSSHIVYFRDGASIDSRPSKNTFTLISLTVAAAWKDNLLLTIKGYRNSTQNNTHTATLLYGKPQIVSLEWKDIDRATFEPTGGTAHPDSTDGGNFVVLTQITVDGLD